MKDLNFNDLEISDFPFLGKLYNHNFDKLSDREQKKLLIKNKIYVIDDEKIVLQSNVIDKNYKFQIGDDFVLSSKNYTVNDELIDEICQYMADDVKSSMAQPIDISKKTIQLYSEHLLTDREKDDFYRKEHQDFFAKIKENENFFMYNDPEAWHYPSWEYYVGEEVRSGDAKLIEQHVFNNGDGYTFFCDISETWQDLFYFTEMLSFLKSRIKIREVISASKLIFKSNGEELFDFIVAQYPKEKNSAFFSYLYFFLRDDVKLLQLTSNDSKDYREYVINKFKIPFARIQLNKSDESYKEKEMKDLFNTYYFDFTQSVLNKD